MAGFTFNSSRNGSSFRKTKKGCVFGSGKNAPMMIWKITNQTTGLKTEMIGVKHAMTTRLSPHIIPNGIATAAARKKPMHTVNRLRHVKYQIVEAFAYFCSAMLAAFSSPLTTVFAAARIAADSSADLSWSTASVAASFASATLLPRFEMPRNSSRFLRCCISVAALSTASSAVLTFFGLLLLSSLIGVFNAFSAAFSCFVSAASTRK